MSTRSEAFLSDAMARDNVTDAELALDKDGTFLGFRVSSFVNAGAYLQSGFQAYTGNLGTLAGVYRHARDVRRVERGVHPHPADAGPIAATAGRGGRT
jgi:CO/xanthine dehydrogenase Mo-binding subunit